LPCLDLQAAVRAGAGDVQLAVLDDAIRARLVARVLAEKVILLGLVMAVCVSEAPTMPNL
jgi:hypothetical protein